MLEASGRSEPAQAEADEWQEDDPRFRQALELDDQYEREQAALDRKYAQELARLDGDEPA